MAGAARARRGLSRSWWCGKRLTEGAKETSTGLKGSENQASQNFSPPNHPLFNCSPTSSATVQRPHGAVHCFLWMRLRACGSRRQVSYSWRALPSCTSSIRRAKASPGRRCAHGTSHRCCVAVPGLWTGSLAVELFRRAGGARTTGDEAAQRRSQHTVTASAGAVARAAQRVCMCGC